MIKLRTSRDDGEHVIHLENHGWLARLPGPVTIGGKRRREAWSIAGRV